MNQKDYYKAPPEKVFNEIKEASLKIWMTYDDTYGYATEKISRIKELTNVSDNAWYMVAMFDSNNQAKLISMVSPETGNMIINIRGY